MQFHHDKIAETTTASGDPADSNADVDLRAGDGESEQHLVDRPFDDTVFCSYADDVANRGDQPAGMASHPVDGDYGGDDTGERLGGGKDLPGRHTDVREAAEHRRARKVVAL